MLFGTVRGLDGILSGVFLINLLSTQGLCLTATAGLSSPGRVPHRQTRSLVSATEAEFGEEDGEKAPSASCLSEM